MDSEFKDLLQAGAAAAAILTCIGGLLLFVFKAIRYLFSKRASARVGDSQQDRPELKAGQIQRTSKGGVSIQAGRDVNMVGGSGSNKLRGSNEG